MARFGVIDLGSNSVRLVVYDVKENTTSPRFRTVVDEKKMAGLAAYVIEGEFTPEGIRRAESILTSQLKTARTLRCERIDIFATAVLRNCVNSSEAVAALEQAIDYPINLLSAREEAHLGFVGATLGHPLNSGTLIDIGGGSTELTVLNATGDTDGISLPQGSVSSYAQFVSLVLPTAAECAAIEQALQTQLSDVEDLPAYRTPHLFGIGGSVRAVAKMQAQALGIGGKPPLITRQNLQNLFELFGAEPSLFAHSAVKACPDRVHTLVPGMVMARTLMDRLDAEDLTVCKYGIREGYLVARMLK